VNTVVSGGGRLRGYNTDGTGFVQALLEETSLELDRSTFLVLGAGGASRALCFALASSGVKALAIIDRLDQASESLVRDINRRVRQCAQFIRFAGAPVGDLVGGCDVLVNASGVGMFPHPEETAVDARTRLLREARQAGCRIMNAMGMAIHQGARGFALLTGRPEPTGIRRRAIRRIIT
jgi:shikimate dehydrogenase